MTFFPSSALLLEPVAPAIAQSSQGAIARAVAKGVLARRAGAAGAAFLVPGAGQLIAGASIALTAWELWNAFEGGAPRPIPALQIPYPPSSQVQEWAIDISYRLEPAAGGLLPARTETIIGAQVFGSPVGLRTFSQNGSNGFEFVTIEDNVESVTSLGGGNEQFLPPRLIFIRVRFAGTSTELLPTAQPVIDGRTPTQPTDVPIDIELPGGGGYPVPIIYPAIVRRPGDLGRRPVPIIYLPTIPQDQRDALPQVWITPGGVQVGTGAQGDPIVITIDGAATTGDLTDTDSDYRRRNPPSVTTCTPEPTPPGDCCDCEEIRQIVIEELDSKFPPARPFELRTTIIPAGESNSFILPEYTQFVELQIVTPPPYVKEQTGGGLAPAVRYNGWYSFGSTGEASERIPFHYDFISVKIPPGVSGFSYTVYSGGTAQATVGYFLEI